MKGKRRIGLLPSILLIADLALLVWICVSFAQSRKPTTPVVDDPATAAFWEEPTYETQYPAGNEPYEPAQTDAPPAVQPTAPAVQETDAPPVQRSGDRPLLSDFAWFTGGGVPAGAARMTELPDATGRWMAYIEWDPDRTNERHEIWLFNAEIDIGQFGTLLTMDWYQALQDDGSVRSDEGLGQDQMMGEWSNGALQAEGATLYRITDFYSLNGVSYAVGTVESYDGVPGRIAMMRK